ncbi:MAG TPA: Fe-S cluster assembly protein SufD [Planctomycetota bacterium]|nr:Fe-S cluster assembly protein SufD [Planctomycetota bacterium]
MDTVTTDPRDLYVADFERAAKALPGLPELRRKAIEKFAERGFPTGREEAWRFTDVTPIAEVPFKPAIGTANPNQFAGLANGALKALQITFVDGRFAPSFSSLDLPPGVGVTSVGEILKTAPGVLAPLVSVSDDPFAALNAAFFRDGVAIRIADGVAIDRPIHVLFLSSLHGEPYVMHPRTVISLGEGARATVVKSYLGPSGGAYFMNAVTTVLLGAGSALDLTKVQRESQQAFHIERVDVRADRGSNFTHHSISLGARIARNDFNVDLEGEGSECSLFGLYEVAGAQHVDHHTSITHSQPHCTSRELYKGVLDGRSRAVFDGRILVKPGAQKTSAFQTNKNLLLSKEALVHTKPQLEIFANDVKCKHGATIGQLDADVLFYLRSRGIGLSEARRLLIHAFASEIVDTVKTDAVRSQIGGCLALIAGGMS